VTLEDAQRLDAADPLAFARDRFRIPDGIIYLDGNSLGALPAETAGRLIRTVEREWGDDLIASWNKHGWIDWPARIAAKLAPIVGARPEELLIADSTSVCLFKLLAAAVHARPGRKTILTRRRNFPTDLYVAEGLADMLGLRLKAVDPEAIVGAIDEDTAAVTLTHVDYRGGAILDMARINEAAHTAGALTVWDLSHSAGAIELQLDSAGCDMAVGCGYKYLNGGPGAPAFLFAAERLQGELASPLQGWMGHADPFAFDDDYRPAGDIRHRGQDLAAQPSGNKALSSIVFRHQGHRVIPPFVSKNHVLRRAHVVDNLHVRLRAMLCQPAAHGHNRRDAAARRQKQIVL